MFGAVDWRSLLTRREGTYDVGASTRAREVPRPTLVAKAAAQLGRGETFDHPGARPARLVEAPGPHPCAAALRHAAGQSGAAARPILITGATGTLGQAFARICAHRGLAHVLTTRAELDITDEASIAAALERYKPWAIINTAGFVRVAGSRRAVRRMLRDQRHRARIARPGPARCTAFRW